MTAGGYHTMVRNSLARDLVHGERDKLVTGAEQRTDGKELRRFSAGADGKDRARALVIAAGMSVFGMVPYALMLVTWFFVFHQSLLQAVVTFAGLAAAGMFFCVASTKRATGKDRPWLRWFGGVWLQALVVGAVVGFFIYFRDLAYFWKYSEMRTYTNIAAAQDASAFGDGSMFLFTEDTRLDALRAVGFKSRWSGDTFCAAPLVDVTMNQASEVNYWAVGRNCCGARAEFLCGDAGDSATRSALRVLEPEDVARPFMRWAVRRTSFPDYMEAVRLEEATYATKSAARPALVEWTRDPVSLRNSFYDQARETCVRVSLTYFACVAVAAYLIAWRLVPQKRPEGVLRG